ncbi:hypothetical protein MKZ38_003843 [Zalerion maritima]|uniref:CorA-like transporter domain-containing protein n=1 Tax=Zalerion maritima TaxID=339359 RepID=A0AAD5RNC5_9PEZI|nr:hypothetical protein MKZ38_003843 [Zalerion maritima]
MTSRIGLKERVEKFTGPDGRSRDKDFRTPRASFISSLAVHILLAQWAIEDWRGYTRWMEEVVEEKTTEVLNTTTFIPNEEDLAFVQAREDEMNKTLMMVESNVQILLSLQKFYSKLASNPRFSLAHQNQDCQDALADFDMQLDDYIQDFRMHAARARTLSKITADRKGPVQQYLQADTTRKMEKLTTEAKRETIVMRIIALITLFYLPATFVSRWVHVTLPLTLLTFVLAGSWLYWGRVQNLLGVVGEFLGIVASHCLPWRRRERMAMSDEEKAD